MRIAGVAADRRRRRCGSPASAAAAPRTIAGVPRRKDVAPRRRSGRRPRSQVHAAHEVLSDARKRAVYDARGQAGLDQLEAALGDGRPAADDAPLARKPAPRAARCEATLADVMQGGDVAVSFERVVCCAACGGAGARVDVAVACLLCDGTGVLLVPTGFGLERVTCGSCDGCGVTCPECEACGGEGRTLERRTATVAGRGGEPNVYGALKMQGFLNYPLIILATFEPALDPTRGSRPNFHVAAAASPRLVSAERPRRQSGGSLPARARAASSSSPAGGRGRGGATA